CVIGAAGSEQVFSVHVEIQLLIELLIADIAAEFKVVPADNLAEIVVELESVSGLRQLSFEVVSEKAQGPVQCDVRHPFEFVAQPRVNAASKTRAYGRVRVGWRAQRIPVGID